MVLRSLLLLALPLTACSVSSPYRAYGADLESRASARALLWPTDAEGTRFRYVVERADRAAQEVERYRPGGDLPDVLAAEDLTGATVLLPPDASDSLRATARSVLDELETLHPTLSRHLVVTEVSWRDVRGLDDLLDRLGEAADAAHGRGESPRTIGDFHRALSVDLLITPRAGADDFLVARATRRPSLFAAGADEYEYSVASAEAAVALLADEPTYEPPGRLRWAVLMVPADADEAARARCDALALDAYRTAHEKWAVLRRTTRVASADDLVDVTALESAHRWFHDEAVPLRAARPEVARQP
ncbi:MAG: hypothetical protein AAGB93_13455 [Planctomycetota bacterium]